MCYINVVTVAQNICVCVKMVLRLHGTHIGKGKDRSIVIFAPAGTILSSCPILSNNTCIFPNRRNLSYCTTAVTTGHPVPSGAAELVSYLGTVPTAPGASATIPTAITPAASTATSAVSSAISNISNSTLYIVTASSAASLPPQHHIISSISHICNINISTSIINTTVTIIISISISTCSTFIFIYVIIRIYHSTTSDRTVRCYLDWFEYSQQLAPHPFRNDCAPSAPTDIITPAQYLSKGSDRNTQLSSRIEPQSFGDRPPTGSLLHLCTVSIHYSYVPHLRASACMYVTKIDCISRGALKLHSK